MAQARKKIKVKAIIFDLGGVVVHGSYLEFINQFCMACLTPIGQNKILELERQVNLGNLSQKQFYEAMRNVFGVHLSPQQMHKIIVKRAKKDKALLKIIKKLGKNRVAMFTNSIGNMALEVMRVKRIPVNQLFKKVFLSTRIHLVKPDARAYRFVLNKLRVKPSKVVMVDDRPVNIRGAQEVGMNTILYRNTRQFSKSLQRYEFV